MIALTIISYLSLVAVIAMWCEDLYNERSMS